MRFLFWVLFFSLYAADNKKTYPIDIPKKDPKPLTDEQLYAAQLYKVTIENDTFKLKEQRSYQRQMKEKKYSADDLKKSGELIREANQKYVYNNPEFTSKDDNKDK